MNWYKSVFLCSILLISISCCNLVKPSASSQYNFRQTAILEYIGTYEVSVADWLTYLVSTSCKDTVKKVFKGSPIFLGDYRSQINDKLPDLSINCWSNYFIKAFLRQESKMNYMDVHELCNNNVFKVYLPSSAMDSITKYWMDRLPVIGVSFEQVFEYCKWRTELANSCGLNLFKVQKEAKQYECFLPNPSKFDSLQAKLDSINHRQCPLFNYKNSFCIDCPHGKKALKHPIAKSVGKEAAYVYGYFPNDLGIYNFKGNVAEMTSTEGVAKGGSCNHYASEAYEGRIQEYSKPELWLGFRVWCRVFEK